MNRPHHPLPDSSTPNTESNFLFDDWDLAEEKSPIGSAALFDGKIIARMPDLGSASIANNIGKPKFPSFWGGICTSVCSAIQGGGIQGRATQGKDIQGGAGGKPANAIARQQFFHRVTAFGGVILLIGAGILFFDHRPFDYGKERVTENAINIAESWAGNAESSITESLADISDSAFSPILQSESGNTLSSTFSSSTIPVAPVESVTAVSPLSPWDRLTESHAPWGIASSASNQSGDPFQPIEVAVADVTAVDMGPPMPPDTVVMSPMTPIAPPPAAPTAMPPTAMPIAPHEMQVSPFETQFLAQSNTPHTPIGTHVGAPVQQNHPTVNHPTVPPGILPMQERLQHMSNVAAPQQIPPQQIPHWHPSAQQQFPPPVHGHVAPMHNNPHGQFRQQHPQYVVPPSYMLSHSQRAHSQAVPQNTPIPSAVSTLPSQGGQHMQSHGIPAHSMPMHGVPMQSPLPNNNNNLHNNFHNIPPTSRWM